MSETVILPGATPVIVTGENTAEVTRQAALVAGYAASVDADADRAEAAQALAEAAALTAPNVYASTAAGLAAAGEGETFWVESGGVITLYRDVSGVATALGSMLTAVYSSGVPGLYGELDIVTEGGTLSITNGSAPFDGSNAVVNIHNDGSLPTGLRLINFWEGSAADPLVNNDTVLFNSFNKTIDNSSNFTWTISSPNAYNWIPEGVRDGGERVAVFGWATSVPTGSYVHSGTLYRQIGVRGHAGFQGYHTVVGSGAVVEEAFCIDARLIRETANATIENGYGVVVRCEAPDSGDGSAVLDYIGVHVRHAPGQNSNFSFKGEAGQLYNLDLIESGTAFEAPSYSMNNVTLADLDGNYNRFYRPDGAPGLYLGNATDPTNLHRNTTHRFENRAGSLLGHLSSSGMNVASGGFFYAGVRVVGPRGGAVPAGAYSAAAPTKAEFDALVDAFNTLRSRCIDHGLIASS